MAKAVSVLRAWGASVLVFCAAFAVPAAWAGDRAQFETLGYSEDGRYFAFEQFGIQDGSGFAYADIFVIDLDTDSFAQGTPVRVRIDEEMVPVAAARAQVRSEAASVLAASGIDRPAVPLALRGDGALDDDGLSIRYGLPAYGLAETQGDYRLSLDIFKAPSSQDCEFFEGDPMAFALFSGPEDARVELYRDKSVPASRHCVITYKFYGVFIPFESFEDASAVAVLSVWSHGFEGPDRRFIALPVGQR